MNPFLGTFIGWSLSFFFGRISKEKEEKITYIMVRRLIPGWAVGQTWGNIILIRQRCDGQYLRKHELVHVEQWKRLGWGGLGFIVAYLFETIKHGYDNNKYENEANGV